MLQTLNFRALVIAALATFLLVVSIFIGSRNLGNFDPALVAYLFACIFACFGVVYRYTVWLQRVPTWRYFARGWQLFFTGRLLAYGIEFVSHFLTQFVGQKFIRNRGKARGYGHMLMAGGCTLAFAVTFPLVFGWIHFGLKPGGIDTYEIYTFGFKTMEFPLHTWIATLIFNALNWSAFLVIAGVMLLMRRRLTHAGQIAIQTFSHDWLPLILLLAISLTGLGITLDYKFMAGKAHQFMAITHAMTVILFLIYMPFGKFYHIIQRPAQLGIAIYRKAGAEGPQAVCPHTRQPFTSKMQVDDLKAVTGELGYDFRRSDGGSHLDYSPQGKRALLAQAHLKARQSSGRYFG
ncbi:MAG: MFS transporter [Bdellovibrionaceae bacterium]|nr:MFS transporter [Pseudobdellovibrionaceae bacterium]